MRKTIPLMLLPLTALADRPAVGQKAPDFSLPSSSGGVVRLADYAGKQSVVLAFFPKAFTGG